VIWDRFRRKKEEIEIPFPKENFTKDELLELKEKISSPNISEPKPQEKLHYPSFPTFEIEKSYAQEKKESIPTYKDIEHKLEMILAKLEIINERLKVIEEKIEKQKF